MTLERNKTLQKSNDVMIAMVATISYSNSNNSDENGGCPKRVATTKIFTYLCYFNTQNVQNCE